MSAARSFALGVVALAAFAAMPLPSDAAAGGCALSDETPLTLAGSPDSGGTLEGRASFVVTCARTQSVTISLVYSHRLRGAAAGTDLAYDLFATTGNAAVWGSGADGAPLTQTFSAGRPTRLFVYARVAARQHPAAGAYDDDLAIELLPW